MISPAAILDFYEQHNFRLVFWAQIGDTKGPTGKEAKGWTERAYPRSEYRDGMRVGIMCGAETTPGKYLHDVDIDWEPGGKIAQALLLKTDLIYGRATKKVSHCWYTTTEALTSFRYEDPTDKTCLIELRGTKLDGTLGNQTMAPPSVWSKEQQKEALEFVRMQTPAHVDVPSVLKQSVCLSAIAMLLAKHFGKQGFGHEMRLAWAGFLLRAGLSVDECNSMGAAIMLYTGNSDKTDIRLAIDTTHKRLESKDKKVKGGPALAKAMGEHGRAIIKRINEWLGRDSDFIRNSEGIIIKDHQENIVRAMQLLNVELSYNAFSDKILVNRTQPLEDRQLNELWFRVDEEFRFRPPFEFFEKCIKRIGWQNEYHPVREYLQTLQWDGTPRLQNWLVQAAGARDSEYVRTVSVIILIAAVRRVRHPGCKYDEMLVLESQQGLQKSSALRALCPQPDWFSDDFELNVSSQRLIESTLGKWIIEASELSGMHKSQVELLKSTLSRQIDGPARMAYARLPIERPRQFILVGTTNDRNYLADSTGARRFWPVEVQRFDVQWMLDNRDQLWAEAAKREADGESNRLPEHLWEAAGEEQEKRRQVDPWESHLRAALLKADELHDYRDGKTRVAASYLWNVLSMDTERQSRRDQMRVSEIMQRLGFTRTKVRPHGETVQVGYVSNDANWVKHAHDEDENVDEVAALRDSSEHTEDDAPF
jgi:predicted P-loop ATPase